MKLLFVLFSASLSLVFFAGCLGTEETISVPQPGQSTQIASEPDPAVEETSINNDGMSTIMVQPVKEAVPPAQGESMIRVSAVEEKPVAQAPVIAEVTKESDFEVTEEPSEIVVKAPKPVEKEKAPIKVSKTEPVVVARKPVATSVVESSAPESVKQSIGTKINMASYYEKQLDRDDLTPELRAYYQRKLDEAKADS